MSSNLLLIACLAAGFVFGFFGKGKTGKVYNALFMGIVIFLLFIMGIKLGVKPELHAEIGKYIYSAIIIAVLAVFFSVAATALLVKLFRGINKKHESKNNHSFTE